jgi:hypothetical protein
LLYGRSGTTTKLFIGGTLAMTKTGDNRNINDSINPGFNLNMAIDNPARVLLIGGLVN